MLNWLWAFMILIGVVHAALTGNMDALTDAALNSAGEAVSLCITMAGVMAFWMGLMEIGQQSGMIEGMTRGLSPFLRFLFPELPEDHPARGYIASNMIANILGLGWACTPAGLKAMEELSSLEEERRREAARKTGTEKRAMPEGTANNEMCTFLILNISSLQLIPVNIIAYRSQYGSTDPAGIIAPAILATAVSTLTAIVYCRLMDRWTRKRAYENHNHHRGMY